MRQAKMLHSFATAAECHAKYDALTDKGRDYRGLSCRVIVNEGEAERFEIWEDADAEQLEVEMAANRAKADKHLAAAQLREAQNSPTSLEHIIARAVQQGVAEGVKAAKGK